MLRFCRRWPLLAALLGLALLAAPQTASAAFQLRLEDGIPAHTVTITDNGAGDLDPTTGSIVYSGSIGAFTISVTTGTSKPVLSQGHIDLNNVSITTTSGGTLTITLADTDFTIPPESANPLLLHTQVGGTINPVGGGNSVSFQGWANADNLSPLPTNPADPTVIPAGSTTPGTVPLTFTAGSFSGVNDILFTRDTGNYSLFSQATINLTAGSSVSFNQDTITTTPAPTSALLALAAMPFFGGYHWLRRRKAVQMA